MGRFDSVDLGGDSAKRVMERTIRLTVENLLALLDAGKIGATDTVAEVIAKLKT